MLIIFKFTVLKWVFFTVFHNEARTKHGHPSCSQIGNAETNVTLMNGFKNPKVQRFMLGHVGTLRECVQIACRRENVSLAYTSRFDCYGISCNGDQEACWLLPSFQNPTLVFARIQRGVSIGSEGENKTGIVRCIFLFFKLHEFFLQIFFQNFSNYLLLILETFCGYFNCSFARCILSCLRTISLHTC